jgi:uncharacterized membrane protein (UPF0127 family)
MLKVILTADDDLKRMKGLMFHRPIESNECAFFKFPRCGQHCFWNNNVDFPISLIFCDDKGTVKDIKYLQAQQKETIAPESYDIKYVIEAHVDAPKKFGLIKGLQMSMNEDEVVFK